MSVKNPRARSRLFFLLILWLGSLLVGQSKVVNSDFSLMSFNRRSWKYLAKFGYNYGNGDFSVRFKFSEVVLEGKLVYSGFPFYVYLDDNWEKVKEARTCEEKAALASVTINAWAPTNGEWSEIFRGSLRQYQRPHVWFFVVADCPKALPQYTKATTRLHFELHMTNSDGSEFSVEEQGMAVPLLLIGIFLACFLIFNISKLRQIYSKEDELDYAYLTLILAIFFEFIAILCEFLHVSFYAIDGRGSVALNFLSQALTVFSQFLVTCLLVLISWGWTITYRDVENFEIFLPLSLLIGVLQLLLLGLAHISDDDSSRYHDFENWSGLLIVLCRLGLFAYFIFGIRETIAKARDRVRIFANRFAVIGSVYLLAFPVLFLVSAFAAAYVRHKIIVLGTIAFQSFGMAILAYSFGSKKSDYAKISFRGRSILPDDKFA